jgi:hypothetical protein
MQIECHGQIVRGTRPNSGRTQLSEISWLNCAAVSLSTSAAAKIVPWAPRARARIYSAERCCLMTYSLLTGNFTGKIFDFCCASR